MTREIQSKPIVMRCAVIKFQSLVTGQRSNLQDYDWEIKTVLNSI